MPPASKTKKTIIIVVVLLVVVLIAAYFIVKTVKEDNKVVVNDTQNGQAGQVEDGLPDEFFSYIGTIVEKNEDGVVIKVEKTKNYLLEDANIEVRVDDETEYQKTVIPMQIEEGEEFNFKRMEMAFADLMVGDEIIAISYENIKGESSFLAKQIEMRKTQ